MLALLSSGPIPTRYVEEFRVLAERGRVSSGAKTPGHRDGWGVVYIDGQPEYMGRSAYEEDGPVEANASTSTRYLEACGRLKVRSGGIVFVHLRRASTGVRTIKNTGPFINDGWCFSHNGTVYGLGSGEISDSRVLFDLLLDRVKEFGGVVEGVRALMKDVRSRYDYSSTTILLSDGRAIYAYRDCTRDEDYYSLMYAYVEHSTILVSQEEMWSLDWIRILNRSMVIIDRRLNVEGPIKI